MTHLKKSDKAPQFEAKIEDGSIISLSDYKGKKKILYFYPKDNTPGCTANACNFKDNYESLTNKGFVVIGVSIQREKSHQKFIDKHKLKVTLLSDIDEKVCNKYGVIKEKNMYGKKVMGVERSTFIINDKGYLVKEWRKVKVQNHVEEVLEFIKTIL